MSGRGAERSRRAPAAISRTRRLLLRELGEQDAEPIARCFADPLTMAFYPATRDREQTLEWLAAQRRSYASTGHGLWAVCDRATGRLLGYCGLMNQWIDGQQELEVGYLIRRESWGQGLATEAARAAVRLARGRFGCARPIALIDPRNAASIRVAEKAGMSRQRETVKWGKRLLLYRAGSPG